jgi:hypothetical protein
MKGSPLIMQQNMLGGMPQDEDILPGGLMMEILFFQDLHRVDSGGNS